MRVLHVVESYGGGVASAIDSYVESVPELEHHIVLAFREGDYEPAGELDRFGSVRVLKGGLVNAVKRIRTAAREVEPQIVHAHSSFGGAFARIALRNVPERKIVYTPHCYAFERRDVSRAARLIYRTAEMLLARNTATVAGCSRREVELGKRLQRGTQAVYVPNVAAETAQISPMSSTGSQIVAGVGRIGPQKDPEFFLETLRALRKHGTVEAIWIGDGDAHARARLTAEDVLVTGWLPRPMVHQHLRSASLYVHSALWEGFPMAVLEAGRMGIPIVARATGPLVDLPESLGATGASQLASIAAMTLGSPEAVAANREGWASYLSENTRANQRAALLAAYGMVGE